ncbi:hypothetical protein FJZ53_00720 [Candidatus Woesearchaeota archaeon]|nr:hypothetical protein [Candidatus Woesearchaeota archaeon]
MSESSYTIQSKEKEEYLRQLDSYFGILAKGLAVEKDAVNTDAVRSFGEAHKWDWSRIPKKPNTYKSLSQLVQRVRQEHWWLDWKIFSKDPSKNFGYFEQLSISSESGLPWVFDFVELHRLKKESQKMLENTISYDDAAKRLSSLMLEDEVSVEELSRETKKLHETAMKRSFFEKLQNAELLGWESTGYSLPPVVTKIMPLGGEDLWNIKLIRYSPSKNLFHAYVIDLWQDNIEPQIIEEGAQVIISKELTDLLKFSEDNSAWYMIKTIDEKFRSIHPVHVSRALIGPFENRYLTKHTNFKPLQASEELLAQDKSKGVLRLSVQYSFAPNHESGDCLRQVIYREDWRDEFIVCPAGCSSKISSSVLGAKVRIMEA